MPTKLRRSRLKHRGLRDSANAVVQRVARDQTEVETSNPDDPPIHILDGNCENHSCVDEEACIEIPEKNNHYCVCTSDAKPPTRKYKCNRKIVPVSPGPRLYVRVSPRKLNASGQYEEDSDFNYASSSPTAQLPISSEEISQDISREVDAGAVVKTASGPVVAGTNVGTLIVASTAGGALLLIMLACIIAFYFRRRACPLNGKVQPRVRPGEPLLAERYITNPQYAACGGGTLGSGTLPGTPGAGASLTRDASNPHLPLLDRTALTFLEEVGEGCFGKVHKGVWRNGSGEIVVAIKVLKESAGRSAEEDFAREVTIMSAFKHPNILSLIGVVYREDIGASPWMIFEYMEWGDLAGVLRGSRGGGRPGPSLDEAALLHVALQVAKGMQYLASRRFVHRDLAARNCLVGTHLAVKIADFGMSRDVYTCDYYKMGGERPMPVRWMSPESIVYARFTHESDVWSYGVVLWEIYSRGKQPFYGHNNDGATKLILQGIVLVPPEDCPRFACDLMRACWQSDPRDRVAFDEICRKLEVAAETAGDVTLTVLPPVSATPQDSAGYLIPSTRPPVEYLAPLPEPCATVLELPSSDEEDDEEDEYT